MTKVFQLSKVNRNTYNESTEKYTNEKDSILDAVHNSLLSPFISQRAFTKEEAQTLFQECATLALERVQSKEILEEIAQKDEILIIFDALLVDYALLNHNVSGEELKATVSKHDLGWSAGMKTFIQSIVDKLFELNETFDLQIEQAAN